MIKLILLSAICITSSSDIEGPKPPPAPTAPASTPISQTPVELLALSDSRTLNGINDVKYRIDRIATIFESTADPRGLFTTVYRPITDRAVAAIQNGAFANEQWARDLVVDFASRYLDNLRLELQGQRPSWAWRHYYRLANDPGVSLTRVATTGIITHLVVDLPYCLTSIGTRERHKADFFLFGDLLLDATDQLINDLQHQYGANTRDLFMGFFVGRWIDSIYGRRTTTTFNFQTIRRKAWNNSWTMRQWWGGIIADSEIYTSFWTMDGILATLDRSGTI